MAANAPAAFFSYCRADSDFALRLAEDLKAAGANVWIDQLDIEPGTRWDLAVEDSLNNCPRMLVILSPASVKNNNVRDEISFALRKQKTIVPVLYLDCDIPLRLERHQQVDFRTDYAAGIKILLKTLSVEPQAQPIQTSPSKVQKHQAVEQSRLEKQGRQAEKQTRLEEERERAEWVRLERDHPAAERTRFEQLERDRQAATGSAPLNQQASHRSEEEHRRIAKLSAFAVAPVGFKKIALVVGSIAVLAVLLYWVTRPKRLTTGSEDGSAVSDSSVQQINKPEQLGPIQELLDTKNNEGVMDGPPPQKTEFEIQTSFYVTDIWNYHWNGGLGTTPGNISLRRSDGKVYGPWEVTAANTDQKINWTCTPNTKIPPGKYTVIDSESDSWSWNEKTRRMGMTKVKGRPIN